MTLLCSFKHKKDLIAHVKEKQNAHVTDPSMFSSFSGTLGFFLKYKAEENADGTKSVTITNDKRSWFAVATLDLTGYIKIT